VRFEVLGPLRVSDDGTMLELGGPRQQRVLACLLAAHPDAVSVDRIVDEVWGDAPPQTAHHVVRTYVSNLRKTLGGRVESDGSRYRLDLDGDEVDVVEARTALEAARHHGFGSGVDAIAAMRDVEALWRGRPYGELADEMPLIGPAAAELEELLLDVREERIAAELAAGRHDAVIGDVQRLCRAHPYRERLHGHLMLALYRAGRQVEALRAYAELRTRLGDDIGIDPSPEIRDLEERILLQDGGLALEPPHQLPAPVSSFVGRGYEVGEVAKLVDAHRLVTLTGPGGVGKTRLANEVALVRLSHLPGGVWWVDLVGRGHADDAPVDIARVLGVGGQPGVEPIEAVANFIGDCPTLLVLDNCEHLLPGIGGLVAGLLERSAGLRMMCTSRTALDVVGEVRVAVPPLSLPVGEAPHGVSDAERLFLTRARELGASIDLGDPVAAVAVERLCTSLDGLPLALELAAARTTVFTPAQLADQVADRLGVLESTAPLLPERHRSLQATIEWSYRLLTPTQQAVFDRLAGFTSTFDVDAAAAVAGFTPLEPGDVIQEFEVLTRASMMQRSGDGVRGVRYRLLDTMRRVAHDGLELRGETEVVAAHHAKHHLGLLERAGEWRLTPEFADWTEVVDACREDLSSAVAWALDREPLLALRAAPGLLEYWFRRGDPSPAYAYGCRVLDLVADPEPRLEAAARVCAGFGAVFHGDLDRATVGIERAIELADEAGGWRDLIWALLARGQNATLLGDMETATSAGRRILEVCDRDGVALPRAYGLALLGEIEFFVDGDLDLARMYLDEAIDGFRRLRDPASLNVFGLGIAASVAALQGDFRTAEELATEATTLPGPGWSATAYVILGGWVLHPQGELERAEQVVRRGVELAHRMSMDPWVRNGLLFLSRIAATRAEWERAARLIGACRPQPPWGQHPRWWTHEPRVREALGDEVYTRLVERAYPLDETVRWIAQ
jgi:predicted ATPase/DNA-binding SARP family transcriptional activator